MYDKMSDTVLGASQMSNIESIVHTYFFHSDVSSTRVVSYSCDKLPVCRT
jgi:hypothetical protein